jgi:hypothetical protein
MHIILVVILLFIGSQSLAWDNPCYDKNMAPKTFPRETRSTIVLEARRVVSVQGNVIMIYDLGKETILIKIEGSVYQSFLKDLQGGRCTARETVGLEPVKRDDVPTGLFRAVPPGKQ